MKVADFHRLKKFMMMTMSGADQEILVAIKQANALLAREGVDWDRVLGRMVRLEVEDVSHLDEDTPLNERINEAFRVVMADDPRGGFATFVASLHDQWTRLHRLTQKQQDALFRAASEARTR